MLGPVGHRYAVVPEGSVANIGGDARPVYATVCGEEGLSRLAVPQGLIASGREISATAGCFEGQYLAGWRVVGVPQGSVANVGGDMRPVYAFSCCPLAGAGGGQSGSSALSSALPSSATPSSAASSATSQTSQTSQTSGQSGSGGRSGSGSGSGPGSGGGSGSGMTVPTQCCPNNNLPGTLYANLTSAPCGLAGTYPMYIDPTTIGLPTTIWRSIDYLVPGSMFLGSCSGSVTFRITVNCTNVGGPNYTISVGVFYCNTNNAVFPFSGWNCGPPFSTSLFNVPISPNSPCTSGTVNFIGTVSQ